MDKLQAGIAGGLMAVMVFMAVTTDMAWARVAFIALTVLLLCKLIVALRAGRTDVSKFEHSARRIILRTNPPAQPTQHR